MERFELGIEVGSGTQGVVYLATEKEDGSKWALKKIECNDESEANKAYIEMLELGKLKHPYIVAYKEFFVSWNKELSAMFVSVVCPYYPERDLSRILSQHRGGNKAVDEELIKKWFGQMLEALMFAHKKKIIHRDLKPSNVFITEDWSVVIGDFGVPTVVKDMRTKTRGTVGSMNWSAPEVLEKVYDERSDVWSLGCILLELMSTAFCDKATMAGKLCEIKHNPQALKELLDQAGQHHSPEMVELVSQMLNKNHEKRPNTMELAENALVKECLAVSSNVLIERKRAAQTPMGNRVFPENQGINAILDYLIDNLGNEKAVLKALAAVRDHAQNENLDDFAKKIVMKCQRDYIAEPGVQCLVMGVFQNLVQFADSNDLIYSREIVTCIPEAMRTHAESSADVQECGASFLAAIAANNSASQFVGDVGGMEDILLAMRNFPDNVTLLAACCNALWTLTVNEDNVRLVTELGGVNDVLAALTKHVGNPGLVEAACAALMALSMEDENLGAIRKKDGVALILDGLQQHMEHARLVKHACMALAAMVEPDEECAFKLLTNLEDGEKEVMGLPIVAKAYAIHKDNAEVVEAIAVLLVELAEYDEICSEMKHLRLGDTILTEIHKRFKENKNIMKPTEGALMKVGGGKIPLRPPSVKSKQRT